MARLTKYGKRDPGNRILAQRITADCPNKAWVSEIRAIFNFVRGHIRYMLDTNEIEVLQSPEFTLEAGSGDCDDHCILIATLLECAGHPCRFMALNFPPDDPPGCFSHVITQTRGAGETPWISLDTTENFPMGWFPPDVGDTMVQDI